MNYDLKPCPYCGTVPSSDADKTSTTTIHPKVYNPNHTYEIVETIRVTCDKCYASGPRKATAEEAVEAWNEIAVIKTYSKGQCVHCGWVGVRKPHAEAAAEIVEHVRTCPKHPYTLLVNVIKEVHTQRADDLCWMDLVKIFAAAGLPAPDCRVGDKFAMLKNCERFVGSLQSGGPWKSYAELMDWIAWLNSQCGAVNVIPDYHTDKSKLTEIAAYIRRWFQTQEKTK